MLHFAETLKDIKAVPRYAVIGICWILFAEVISGLVFSGGGNHIGMILVQITRTAQFLLALIFTIKVRNVKVVCMSWIYYGIICAISAFVLQAKYGSVTAIRGGAGFGLSGIDNIAATIANLAYMCIVSFWLFLGLRFLRKERKPSVWSWGIGSIFLVASLYSGRRQAIIALIISSVLFIIMFRNKRKLTAIAMVILSVVVLYQLGPMKEFLTSRGSILNELIRPEKGTGYLYIHQAGIKAFLSSPIFGIGLGNYKEATGEAGVLQQGGNPMNAHNSMIRILAETGIVGGLGFVVLMIGFIYNMFNVWIMIHRETKPSWINYLFPIAGVVITGFTVTILDQPDYIFLFGQVIAIFAIYTHAKLIQSSIQSKS